MNTIRKIIKWMLFSITIIFLLLTLSIEIYSTYKIHEVNPQIINPVNYYSADIFEILWSAVGENMPIEIEPFYVSQYIYTFIFLGIVFPFPDNRVSYQGYSITSGLAQQTIYKAKNQSKKLAFDLYYNWFLGFKKIQNR